VFRWSVFFSRYHPLVAFLSCFPTSPLPLLVEPRGYVLILVCPVTPGIFPVLFTPVSPPFCKLKKCRLPRSVMGNPLPFRASPGLLFESPCFPPCCRWYFPPHFFLWNVYLLFFFPYFPNRGSPFRPLPPNEEARALPSTKHFPPPACGNFRSPLNSKKVHHTPCPKYPGRVFPFLFHNLTHLISPKESSPDFSGPFFVPLQVSIFRQFPWHPPLLFSGRVSPLNPTHPHT